MADFISDFNSMDDFQDIWDTWEDSDVEGTDVLISNKKGKDVGITNNLISFKNDKNIAVNMVSSKREKVDMTDIVSVKKKQRAHSKPQKKVVQQKLNLTVIEYSKATQQNATSVYDKCIFYSPLKSSNGSTKNFGNRESAITDYFSDYTDEFTTKLDCSGNKNVLDTVSNKKRNANWIENKVENSHHKERCLQKKTTQQKGTSAFKKVILHGTSAHENNLDALDPLVIKLSTELCNFNCINAENLSLKYHKIFSKILADSIFHALEEQVEYFSGDLLKVKVYGKWHNIPRKQACYGDPGLSYSFSGNCFPAQPWSDCAIISSLRKTAESLCKHPFNFVLVNRYKDGKDHMGEHRDDEKDLLKGAPIASMSFGQPRDFIFRHKDSRGPKATRKIPPQKLNLEHGSLLIMESPTNQYWYHSLPVRANAKSVRVNLTFRCMVR